MLVVLRDQAVGFLVLGLLWGLLNFLIPAGWVTAVANITMLLVSGGVGATTMILLKPYLSRWLSAPLAALLWLFVCNVPRSQTTDLLIEIFRAG